MYVLLSSNDSSFMSSLAMTIHKGYGITERGSAECAERLNNVTLPVALQMYGYSHVEPLRLQIHGFDVCTHQSLS